LISRRIKVVSKFSPFTKGEAERDFKNPPQPSFIKGGGTIFSFNFIYKI